jgi:hypothetical protein
VNRIDGTVSGSKQPAGSRPWNILNSRMWPVVWAPLAVVALHSVLSIAIGHRRDLDPLFHFLGGIAGAYALLQIVRCFPQSIPMSVVRHRTTIVIGLVVAATLLWEFMEFGSDRLLGTHVQLHQGDTLSDIALGIGGGALMATLAALIRRNQVTISHRMD